MIFHAKPSLILSWLNAKGHGGTVYDALNSYFGTKSSLDGTLEDKINDTLQGLGYSGTLHDKLSGFFTAQTGQGHRGDAERSFFQDSSNDFGAGGGSTDEFYYDSDGNILYDSDGNAFVV